ncbi:hypothetical protein [Candidatus Pelagibacter sp. HIMB1542]|uniref:hypothetical protein n=1 Tax=Candidatus Pelagibacter sp. HIMB1542 TaxID=3413346 RepID=UPI003F86627E
MNLTNNLKFTFYYLILFIFTTSVYAENTQKIFLDSLFKTKSKKEISDISKNIKFYDNLIQLFPSNIDALEEKKLNELNGLMISINEVQIFAMDDSQYVNTNIIRIASDTSVKMWQLTCKLHGEQATNFLKLAKGKSVVVIKLTGKVLKYRRSSGMLLDNCKFE